MLQCAAAAGAEMLADRLSALVAGLVDVQQMPAIGMTGNGLDSDGFSGKRVGHVNRAIGCVGDAVAAMAKPRNNELLSHAPLQAGIRCFHRRQ